jgi:uracil-DNA glycosylase
VEVRIEPSWKHALEGEFSQQYFKSLTDFVRAEINQTAVYPPGSDIYKAFNATPLSRVKVCILGQDPYHGPGQANGLAFSVNDGVQIPPSLQNIFKEIKQDIGGLSLKSGNLEPWACQGVLLLNATLTVRASEAGSHQNKGWERFTDAVVAQINSNTEGVVFMLWGSYAQKKGLIIDPTKHLVLKSPHPSPLSAHRGFLGNQHFSQANAYLKTNGKEPIDW